MLVFLEKVILPVLVFLAGAVLVTNPMKWTGTQRIEGGIVDLVAALVVALLVQSRTRKRVIETIATQPTRAVRQPALPVGVTPEHMTSIFNDRRYNTNQAKALTQDYIGKWMEYSGKVYDVHDDIVFFQDPKNAGNLGVVHAVFAKDWMSRISVLPPGGDVRVVGRVTSISRSVTLRDCEIVDN